MSTTTIFPHDPHRGRLQPGFFHLLPLVSTTFGRDTSSSSSSLAAKGKRILSSSRDFIDRRRDKKAASRPIGLRIYLLHRDLVRMIDRKCLSRNLFFLLMQFELIHFIYNYLSTIMHKDKFLYLIFTMYLMSH